MVVGFGDSDKEPVKKSKKLNSQNLSKSQKLTKSRKKSSKSENSPNFDVKKNGPSLLTPKAKTAFNCLQLDFINALIL